MAFQVPSAVDFGCAILESTHEIPMGRSLVSLGRHPKGIRCSVQFR